MIDRSKLETLLGDDSKMVQRFLEIFKTQTPKQLNLLIESVAKKNWDQASITAHAIKSQCKYLGLEEMAEHAFKIEQLTEEKKQLELMPGLVVKLKENLIHIIQIELD